MMLRLGMHMTKPRYQHRHANSRQQGEGEFNPVVSVKLKFRQQIGASDAQESSRAKRQRRAQPCRLFGRQVTRPQEKQQRAQRCDRRKRKNHPTLNAAPRVARMHQRADGQRAKRFVKDDRQRRAQSERAVF